MQNLEERNAEEQAKKKKEDIPARHNQRKKIGKMNMGSEDEDGLLLFYVPVLAQLYLKALTCTVSAFNKALCIAQVVIIQLG